MDRRSLLLGRRRASPAETSAPARPPTLGPEQRPPPAAIPTAGGLAVYVPTAAEPWDARRARHLLRRAVFAAPQAGVAAALARAPEQVVDALVDDALRAGLPPVPDYAHLFPPVSPTPEQQTAYNGANSAAANAQAQSVMRELRGLRAPGSALNERMALVWHGLTTTNRSSYSLSSRLYSYWTVLERNALGSFETLIREVGTTQAMLVYLNGSQNRVGSPNENYAREVLELFTLGVTGPDGSANYTQADITNLARCFTGWQTPSGQAEAAFTPGRFDAGQKTLFGQTGAFTYATAHDVLFARRGPQIAHHAARVLYRAFVAATPNETVVAQLATVLRDNGLQVAPAVRALLKSQHFFSAGALGAAFRDPLALMLGLTADLGWSNPEGLFLTTRSLARDAGYELFAPPDVAAWPGGRAWLDTASVPLRSIATDRLVAARAEGRALAATLPQPTDPYAVVDDLAERLVPLPLAAATRAEAVTVLLGGIPDYEWSPTVASAEGRIRSLVQFLARLPESHLY